MNDLDFSSVSSSDTDNELIDNLSQFQPEQQSSIIDQNDIKFLEELFLPEERFKAQYDAIEIQENFAPRDYQIELYKKSRNKNSIIFLETGKGKTLIALMHIYNHIKMHGVNNVKIIFLANTIQLVEQQAKYIRNNLYKISAFMESNNLCENNFDFDINQLKDNNYLQRFVIPIHSKVQTQEQEQEIDVNGWKEEKWNDVKQQSTVLIMMGQMLLNALRRGYLKLPHFSLIIFDECHHTRFQHSYRLILKEFSEDEIVTKQIKNSDKVHIIGLTASPVISVDLNKAIARQRIDGRSIEIQLLQLAQNMHCKYVFEDDNQKQSHEQISKPHYINYEEQMGISEYYIPQQERITKTYSSLMLLIKGYMNTNIKYEMQLFLQQLKHYMISHGLIILKELGTYSFYQFLLQIRLDISKIPQVQRSLSDTQIMKSINELLSKSIDELKDLDDFNKIENLCQKFGNLIKYLQNEKQRDETQFKQQKLIIFVDQKIIAKYLTETLLKLGFECNFVVGTGNKASGSLQQRILAQRNVKIQLENLHKIDVQQLAIDLYKSYEPTEFDIENENFDQENSVANQLAKDQLVELQEGIKKLGKHLDQTDIEAKEQQRIIKSFRQDIFNILVSTNVTEEGFDIPDCNSIIIYGKITTLKQFIQKTGRARKGDKKIVMVLEQSECNTIDIKVSVLQKTINCIKQKIFEFTDQDYVNTDQKIRELQLEIDHNYQFINQQEYYERSLVRNSLALLNTNWAVEILSNYANLFRYDHKDTENFIKGVFYSFTRVPAVGWRCVIILPKNSQERYFIGKIQTTKDRAKASAAYEAVLKLRRAQMLTDDLRPIKGSIQYRGDQADDNNMNDPEYQKIVNQSIIFKYEDKVDLTQKFFPFKLDVFRIDLKQKLNVYKFTFCHDDQSQIEDKQYNHLNEDSNCPTILGLIHNIELERMSFSVGNQVKIEKVNEIELSFQDYLYYYKVHLFLFATTQDWDIQYYSNITKDPIKINSHLFQNKKIQPFDDIDNQNTFALLVLLKKTEEDNYVLNDQVSQQIIDYQTKMEEIYKFLNSIKEKKEQNKIRKEQQNRLNDSTIKMNRWNKIAPDFRVAKILASDQFRGLVVQNISENFHLGKMVILEKKVDGEEEQEQKMSQVDQSENEKKVKKEKDRKNALRGIIDDQFNDDFHYNAPVLKKYLKIPIKKFKKIITSSQQKDGNHIFYGAEFYKFPLNLGTCFKLRILITTVFPKLRDFIVATTLKEHNNLSENFFYQKQFQAQKNNLGIYNYTVMNNIIMQDQEQFLTFLQTQKLGQDDNLSYLLEQFQQNIQYKQQNQINQYEQLNHQNYFLNNIDQSLIYQCFQSQIYNQEDKSNYQVLEFLGDAILKLLSSIEVFVENPFVNENILHTSRARIISNENLRRISIINKFFEYTLCYKFEFWPQGFISNNLEQPVNDDKKDLNRYHAKLNDQIIDKLPYNYQNIPDKVHSDVVEALNGAFMQTYHDIDACQTFLFQIGVLKYPDTKLRLQYSQTRQTDGLLGEMIGQLENILNYNFNDQSLIIQALTHPSFLDVLTFFIQKTNNNQIAKYNNNHLNIDFQSINHNLITEDLIKNLNQYQARPDMAYERLEFLGDAVLDAVVVDWLVKQFPNDYAEDLSLKKQCIVCNKALALATLSLGLEKYLFHPTLHNPMHDHNKVLQRIREKYAQYFNDISTMYTQEPLVKILGDIFESIVGAIFVDSEFNYKLISKVIINLLQPFMEHFTSPNQIQKNPQDRLNRYFKHNNQGQMELIITDADMVQGESEYVLKSQKSDQIFKRVRASSEKQAREKILEYLSKKGEI